MKPGPKRSTSWGLSACPPQRECRVCAVLGEKPEDMRAVRDLYVQGVPVWFVAQQFKVPNQALRVHAWCHNWWRRRSLNLPSPKHLLTMLALARLRSTWHLADGASAERALALLVKLSGVGEQESTEREPGLTWEALVRQDLEAQEKA